MSRPRSLSSRNVAICGIALLVCAGCRTRQPAVILSPKYAVPNPYAAPRAAVATPVVSAIAPRSREAAAAYAVPVAPIVSEAVVSVSPVESAPQVERAPVREVVVPPAPSVPTIRLEPIAPVRVVEAPVSAAPAPKRGGFWTVKKGDSLWAIGRKYGVSVSDLAAANGITTKSLLKIGQRLAIPKEGWVAPAAVGPTPASAARASTPPTAIVTVQRPRAPVAPSSTSGVYVVVKGDSLWKIARNHNVSVADLMSWNQLSSDRLSPGQELTVVPGAVDAGVKVSTAKAEEPPALDPVVPTYAKPISDKPISDKPTGPAPSSPKSRVLPHYVAPGDSLRSIAMLYDANEGAIREKNPQVSDFGRLVPGTRIEVPLARSSY